MAMSFDTRLNRPFWAEAANPDIGANTLAGAHEADVAVIGAGFTGLRAAHELTRAGTSVAVLDAGTVAGGASGRTGGQVNPMLPFNTPDQLRALLGDAFFDRLVPTALGSADALFDYIRAHQFDCDARQNGWLRVCHSAGALRNAKANAEAWNRLGAGMEIVGREDIFALSGTRAYHAGIVTPRGGAVQPMKLALAMARAVRQQGGRIYEHSAVLGMDRQGARWILRGAQGQVSAAQVIVATNGYSGDLIPKLSRSIIAATPIQMATDPLPEGVIGQILPQGHTISDSRRVIMYARREPDNRMVYGSHGSLSAANVPGGFKALHRDALRVFPQLKDAHWTHGWGGRVAVTDDHLPHLHQPQPGVLVGLGYNGRGVAMSQVMGQALAARALGRPEGDIPLPVTEIKPIFAHAIQTRGVGTAVWFLRLLDYLESR